MPATNGPRTKPRTGGKRGASRPRGKGFEAIHQLEERLDALEERLRALEERTNIPAAEEEIVCCSDDLIGCLDDCDVDVKELRKRVRDARAPERGH